MAKADPTKDPEFQRTLRNLLTAPPKRQAEMKIGKKKKLAKRSSSRSRYSKNPG
jgi:hypothetical protein